VLQRRRKLRARNELQPLKEAFSSFFRRLVNPTANIRRGNLRQRTEPRFEAPHLPI
jgi:hypothetical protein